MVPTRDASRRLAPRDARRRHGCRSWRRSSADSSLRALRVTRHILSVGKTSEAVLRSARAPVATSTSPVGHRLRLSRLRRRRSPGLGPQRRRLSRCTAALVSGLLVSNVPLYTGISLSLFLPRQQRGSACERFRSSCDGLGD